MKTEVYVLSCSMLFMFACESDTYHEKGLSHIPTGVVYVETANTTIKIDFGCNEDIASHIFSEDNQVSLESISARSELIRLYEERLPVFEWCYSDHIFPGTDNDYVFPKFEYLLAQECFQDDCSSETRKTVL